MYDLESKSVMRAARREATALVRGDEDMIQSDTVSSYEDLCSSLCVVFRFDFVKINNKDSNFLKINIYIL